MAANANHPLQSVSARQADPFREGLPRRLMAPTAATAVAALVLTHGFPLLPWVEALLPWVVAAAAGLQVTHLILSLKRTTVRLLWLRRRWHELVLLLVFGLGLLVLALGAMGAGPGWVPLPRGAAAVELGLVFAEVYVALNLGLQALRLLHRAIAPGLRPEYLLAGSFAGLIAIGTGLLLLPRAAADPARPITLLDAFFTATSAVSVTGLVVRDTGSDFSLVGQAVILGLIQAGGLGIITFVVLISVMSSQSFSVPQLVMLRNVVSAQTISDVKRQILGIAAITLCIELCGALALRASLPEPLGDSLRGWWWSLFHAVSGFCNAGFGLHADSLEQYRGNVGVNLTLCAQVILGGLGFPIILELLAYRVTGVPLVRRWLHFRRRHLTAPLSRLTVQTRLALLTMVALLVLGTVGFYLLETTHLMLDLPQGEQWLAAFFHATIARTAGFNTLPIGSCQDATQILMMALMVIGASPLSTGGGIKTVAFAVLLLTLRAMLTGRDQIEVFGRALPRRVIHAAISVFVIYTMGAVLIVFGLAITDPAMALQAQVFEVISALSTVGLSTGITAQLSPAGKLLLCLAMFMGRVGPLTLVISIFHAGGGTRGYRYPEEDLVVT